MLQHMLKARSPCECGGLAGCEGSTWHSQGTELQLCSSSSVQPCEGFSSSACPLPLFTKELNKVTTTVLFFLRNNACHCHSQEKGSKAKQQLLALALREKREQSCAPLSWGRCIPELEGGVWAVGEAHAQGGGCTYKFSLKPPSKPNCGFLVQVRRQSFETQRVKEFTQGHTDSHAEAGLEAT